MNLTLLSELQAISETLQGETATEYDAVLEADFTIEELEKVEKLRKHFAKNLENDVRNYIDAVRVLFPTPTYVSGCGGTHIWVHRADDINARFLYIGSEKNCEMWKIKTN